MQKTGALLAMCLLEVLVWTMTDCRIIEGDIYIRETKQMYAKQQTSLTANHPQLWNHGRVPVYINFPEGGGVYNMVKMALDTITHNTGCVTFPDRTTETDYVNITRIGRGCYAEVGYKGGQQLINVGEQCESVGIILHEVLHTLGLWHEHSRSDRDLYVKIFWENIISGEQVNFQVIHGNQYMEADNPYDLLSIMHYKYNQFSVTGSLPTIIPRDRRVPKEDIGQRQKLSYRDVQKIQWLYKSCIRHDSSRLTNTPSKSEYGVGETVTFSCYTGYHLVGATNSRCLRGGKWSGILPICIEHELVARTFLPRLVDTDMDVPPTFIGKDSRWQRHKGEPLSDDSGPIGDHTYDAGTSQSTGAFYYFNAKGLPEDAAVPIYMPFIYCPDGTVSILFFYSMNSSGVGKLDLKIYDYTSWQRPDEYTWTSSGSTSDRGWHCAHIPAQYTGTGRFKYIVLTATSGPNDDAIIAIDDILIGPSKIVDEYAALQGCGKDKQDEYGVIATIGQTDMKYS